MPTVTPSAATIRGASWDEIQQLRDRISPTFSSAQTLSEAAQRFAEGLAVAFSTVALARVFLVVPFQALAPEEQASAERFAQARGRALPLAPQMTVLSLLGTAGTEPSWNDRAGSAGHRAIPLLDRALIESAPMIAALLSSLRLEDRSTDTAAGVQLRPMSGGLNSRFYVADARASVDAAGRTIIADTTFVARHGIRTVFGMGGTYVNGWTVVAIIFTTELLDLPTVDRFASFIGTFKLGTAELLEQARVYPRS